MLWRKSSSYVFIPLKPGTKWPPDRYQTTAGGLGTTALDNQYQHSNIYVLGSTEHLNLAHENNISNEYQWICLSQRWTM